MADFDDLISSTSRPSVPLGFDNPFQDVFDGVSGRPRSPDPWSSGGAWGEVESHVPSHIPRFETSSPPTSPGGFKDFSHSDAYDDEPQPSLRRPLAEEPSQPDVDPLALGLDDDDEPPPKRNPLGPLPPPPKEVTLSDESTKTQPASAAEEPATTDDVPVVLHPPTPGTEPSASPVHVTVPDVPKSDVLSTPLDGPLATHARVTPPIPPSPLTPHPPTPSSSSGFSRRNHSVSASESNNSVLGTESTANIQYDRIVSPLETPPGTIAKRTSLEQGFSKLALGGEVAGWGGLAQSTYDDEHGGFGREEPQNGRHDMESTVSPSRSVETVREDTEDGAQAADDDDEEDNRPLGAPPVFIITVGDPQKKGDPLKAHIVYTVHTKTTSPAFVKPSFSVLRRYSDFLWLYETLSANNPGVIVPPVPEKNPFNISRFEADFIENRRLALNKCIQKIAIHPLLSKDEDFRFFLESDSFALDIKHRRGDNQTGGILGALGSFAAPRFYEIDEWFDNKRAYLDALESQLKGLVKAIEIVTKQRSDFALTISEFADAISALSMSDLSKQLTTALASLAEVERLYKDMQDSQTRDDLVTIMGTADEYSRLINSVRLAFNSRIKLYFAWQSADTDARRIKANHDRARRQGRSTGSMAEIADFSRRTKADRRAVESKREFDTVTKLIKMELARFEKERVEDFKVSLEQFLEGMIRKQRSLIAAWENHQAVVLRKLGTNPTNGTHDSNEPEEI